MGLWEVEEKEKVEWVMGKEGCMECWDGGWVKGWGGEGGIIEYGNGMVELEWEEWIGWGYWIGGCGLEIGGVKREEKGV